MSRRTESSGSLESRFQQLAVSSTPTSGKQTSTNVPRSHTAVDPTTGAETRWELSQPPQAPDSTQQSWNPKRVLELEGRRDQNVVAGKSLVIFRQASFKWGLIVVVGYAVSKQPQTDFRTGRVGTRNLQKFPFLKNLGD